MAYYSTTSPPDQPQTSLDIDAITTGFGKIYVDGAWIGGCKEGSKANFNWNPLDKMIVVAQYPGTALGKRQLGESPTVTFESIELTVSAFKRYFDVRANVNGTRLSLGMRNKRATEHTLTCYGEGAGRRTRKWEFYRVTLEVDGDVNILDGEDFVTCRVIARILPQMNLPEASWYGEVEDSPPS